MVDTSLRTWPTKSLLLMTMVVNIFLTNLLHFRAEKSLFGGSLSASLNYVPVVLPDRSLSCNRSVSSFTSAEDIRRVIKDVFESHGCSELLNETYKELKLRGCVFENYFWSLLDASEIKGSKLLSIQIGGMDGRSNDPLYAMFHQGTKKLLIRKDRQMQLKHWFPVVFEPVQDNFVKLQETYQYLHEMGLPCSLLQKRAINYGGLQNETCIFCAFDASDTASVGCKARPDWIKLQIGTLQCEWWDKSFIKEVKDNCIVRDPVECGTVEDALESHWGLNSGEILPKFAVLQIDVEGLEPVILNGMLDALPANSYPQVIHFERKVLEHRDRKEGTRVFQSLLSMLRIKGYVVFHLGEDALALLLNPSSTAVM